MADNIETIATIAMQSSKAWPAVFHQGAALCLWRAAVAAIEAAGFSIVPNADLAAARAENERLREARAQAQQLEPGARDVLAERRRQVSAEGWDTKHDDRHTDGELAVAASCYANPVFSSYGGGRCPIAWPWNLAWWKPKDRRSDLVRAGALILAEIARLDRARAALAEKEPAK